MPALDSLAVARVIFVLQNAPEYGADPLSIADFSDGSFSDSLAYYSRDILVDRVELRLARFLELQDILDAVTHRLSTRGASDLNSSSQGPMAPAVPAAVPAGGCDVYQG
jgi:hypothetical protein